MLSPCRSPRSALKHPIFGQKPAKARGIVKVEGGRSIMLET